MKEASSDKTIDFSIANNGLLHGLMGRVGLLRPGTAFLVLRVLIMWLITWFPMFMLSIMEGQAIGNAIRVPFLYDLSIHTRFLFVAPLFLMAELVVEPRVKESATEFIDSGIVDEADLPGYRVAFQRTLNSARSIVAELILLGIVIAFAAMGFRKGVSTEVTSWEFVWRGGVTTLTPAGWWFAFVGIPVYQFLVLRWLWMLLVWTSYLWRVSRLNLRLIPAHPDQAGGLGFLGITQTWFAPFVLGLASVNASVLANQILYEGATLVSFMPQIILFVGVILLVFLGPLLIFSPKMIIAKRRGLLEYATLASSFVRAFDRRWLKGPEIGEEQLLGNADFSAHADLGATFTNLRGMKIAPIDLNTVLFFLGAALLPMLPLLLLAFTPEQIFGVIKGIFL